MTANTTIRASLIVLNYQGEDLIGPCIDSLQRDRGEFDEIIVVDNGSTDRSLEIIRSYDGVHVVELAKNTYIFGLNDGVAASSGEYVVFLNNDIVVEEGFTSGLVAGFDTPDIFAVCPRILDRHGGEQGARTGGYWHSGLLFYASLSHCDSPTDCFFAVGGQSMFRRSMLNEIGSIDPLFWPMYHEDIELSYRAWKRGWRIRYTPAARVHHLGSATSSRVFSPSELRSFVRQNEYLTVWKDVTDIRLLVEHIALIPARLGAAVIKRDWPTLRGFYHAVRRFPLALKRRRAARPYFVLTDREVLSRVNPRRLDQQAGPRHQRNTRH